MVRSLFPLAVLLLVAVSAEEGTRREPVTLQNVADGNFDIKHDKQAGTLQVINVKSSSTRGGDDVAAQTDTEPAKDDTFTQKETCEMCQDTIGMLKKSPAEHKGLAAKINSMCQAQIGGSNRSGPCMKISSAMKLLKNSEIAAAIRKHNDKNFDLCVHYELCPVPQCSKGTKQAVRSTAVVTGPALNADKAEAAAAAAVVAAADTKDTAVIKVDPTKGATKAITAAATKDATKAATAATTPATTTATTTVAAVTVAAATAAVPTLTANKKANKKANLAADARKLISPRFRSTATKVMEARATATAGSAQGAVQGVYVGKGGNSCHEA